MIAGIAIGALVDKRSRLWLAGLFGAADCVAFLIGAGLGWGLLSATASEVVEVGALVALGLYLLVVVAGMRRAAATWPVWLVPIVLTVDNLTFGLAGETSGSVVGEAATMALSSSLLAIAGLAIGAWLPRVLPAARTSAPRVAGAGLLFAAGALFVVG